MAGKNTPVTPGIGTAIEATVTDSATIGSAIEGLILEAIHQLRRDLKIGDEKRRSDAMKLIMSHAMKAREQKADSRMEEIAAEMRAMISESMGT